MATLNRLEVASGSARGRDHARAGRTGQDASHVERGDDRLVAVVADGCGSAPHSELGARLGARLFAACLARSARPAPDARTLERARDRVIRHLAVLARSMGGSTADVVRDHFLFTIVGAIVTPEATAVFSIGDGLYAIDGELVSIGPFPGDAPPYLAYALLPGGAPPPVALHARVPTASLRTLLIGTDGALPFCDAAGLRELFETDLYYANRDALRRRLHRLAEPRTRIDWSARRVETEPARLADDATLVAVRRREGER